MAKLVGSSEAVQNNNAFMEEQMNCDTCVKRISEKGAEIRMEGEEVELKTGLRKWRGQSCRARQNPVL